LRRCNHWKEGKKVKIEIREGSVLIDGYVNAVERYSNVIWDQSGSFVEKIRAGAFRRALERSKATGSSVKVLLNHDYGRELTSTKEQSTQIWEDNIGLRCRCEIRDAEVVQKAREGKLVGWSFGFIAIRQARETRENGEVDRREIMDLELKEVSILDDRKKPAYDGTSIETREDMIELRMMEDETETVDTTPTGQKADNYKFRNRILATRASR
jgi:hypothetical protein